MLEVVKIQEGTVVEYSSNELLFLAQSGQPYRGVLYVKFRSVGESFDTLSFKRYITSLRAKKLMAEDIAYEIYSTIDAEIQTQELGVLVDLTARGGIKQRLSFGSSFEPTHKANIFQVG